LGRQPGGKNEGQSQQNRRNPPKIRHGGSLAVFGDSAFSASRPKIHLTQIKREKRNIRTN
jgi:hypothetical protein